MKPSMCRAALSSWVLMWTVIVVAVPAMASQGVVVRLDSSLGDGTSVAFRAHEGEGRFGTYAAMALPYEPARDLRLRIEQVVGRQLRHRGEAHVTVVTPPEYSAVLSRHLSPAELTRIVREQGIQRATLDFVCIGSYGTELDGQFEETFYVVVQSRDLTRIRRAVQRAYVDAGGTPADFDPEHFFPHVTLGFTRRDLHESDGAVKDATSCDPRFRLMVSP